MIASIPHPHRMWVSPKGFRSAGASWKSGRKTMKTYPILKMWYVATAPIMLAVLPAGSDYYIPQNLFIKKVFFYFDTSDS